MIQGDIRNLRRVAEGLKSVSGSPRREPLGFREVTDGLQYDSEGHRGYLVAFKGISEGVQGVWNSSNPVEMPLKTSDLEVLLRHRPSSNTTNPKNPHKSLLKCLETPLNLP